MNNDKVKGTIDDTVGRAKRQVGEWTGDTKTQVEGAAQQIKGKAEKAVGNVKDAVHDAGNKMHDKAKDAQTDADREREHIGSGHRK
jgi:uncharacterized protein YjbJ (UPF0337 family)